ncbi:hypothetical protein BV25DRAFT_1291600 [Artomyces pyxidatus]|uniref:Uncharacterized protein n=1 Tax=Artomyces pyxidatus TaxID=48021 RepID=A0ACB8SP46_9AGAM|nr:hypothetical protein BV25DRAFT_1291600 [Artomyces pyxidatus]
MAEEPPAEHTVYELHFLGNKLDPRHGFTIMGAPDVYMRFDTPVEQLCPIRTTIRGLEQDIAWFDWALHGSAPGMVTIVDPPRRFHMHEIAIIDGQPPYCRAFYSAPGPTVPSRMYRWFRRDRQAYELYTDCGTLIGAFSVHPVEEDTEAGRLFASFSYNFHWKDPLLMDAMLTLSLNRFLDQYQDLFLGY